MRSSICCTPEPSDRLHRLSGESPRPAASLTNGISNRTRQNRDREQAGTDHSECEHDERKTPYNGAQRLGGLSGSLNVSDSLCIQRRRCHHHDCKCNEVSKGHTDQSVDSDAMQSSLTLRWSID
jgi:hypothetical protein